MSRSWLPAIFLALVYSICGSAAAYAQSTPLLSSSYITPFPQSDRYHVRIIGDWFSAGLASGLEDAFKNDSSVQFTNDTRSNYGLVRADQTDLSGEIDRIISAQDAHIAVLMLGANDRASIRTPTGHLQPGSEEWKDLYGKEVEKLTRKLRAANIAVYWAGLPVMSSPSFNEFVASINDTVRQAAYLSGAKFIETSVGFTDQLGGYTAFGPDVSGQTKRLREADGVGLTQAGSRKLASYVEIALRRDLALARAQRNIPLAGDEEEQARVVPPGTRGAAPAKPASASDAKGSGPASLLTQATPGAKPDQSGKASAFKTELAAASAAGAAQREQAAFAGGASQQGELILADLGNGLTSIAVISPVTDFSIREIQRQTPLADRLYFKVLSKGEALPPKEGRADDFHWRGEGTTQSQ